MLPTVFILNPRKVMSNELFKSLFLFNLRKNAAAWCKKNNIKPARIVRVESRWQIMYALDMGRNNFVTDDKEISC